ncbi:MAG: radical SAM family heme chaperone HemW [Thermosulfidibacteraceae bacterium]
MKRGNQTGKEGNPTRIKGIYVHVPFCIKKCRYCDFYSLELRESYLVEAYLEALEREIKDFFEPNLGKYTLYIGGGTPTALDFCSLRKLLEIVGRYFGSPVEFTVEANPLTLDREKLGLLKDYGVTRVSLGVQSFSDRVLRILGRIHTSRDAIETIENASHFFENFNIDMIYSVPGEELDDIILSFDHLKAIRPPHVSAYAFTLEEGTPIYRDVMEGKLTVDDEDTFRYKYDHVLSTLRTLGYEQYEVSNFTSSRRYRCLHNLVYWMLRDYYGFGPSAHSYFGGVRYENRKDLYSYIKDPKNVKTIVSQDDSDFLKELVMLSLRTSCGLSLRKIPDSYRSAVLEHARDLEEMGLVNILNDRIVVTDEGYSVLSSIIVQIWEALD